MFHRWFIWCLMLVVLGSGAVVCTGQNSQLEFKSEGEFPLTVDYSQPLVEMIAAGHYDRVNQSITADHFPIQGRGTSNVIVRLVHFNERVSTEEALRRLDEQGLRPAILPELLAFGVKYPDKQKEFPIVALGSSWVGSGGFPQMPHLYSDDSDRELRLNWFDKNWYKESRFLAVPQSVRIIGVL